MISGALNRFLSEDVGIPSDKSLMGALRNVPVRFLPSLIRGLLDGDGTFGVNGKIRTVITAKSKAFLLWLLKVLREHLSIVGGSIRSDGRGVCVLSLGKADTYRLVQKIYADATYPHFLPRKRDKIVAAFGGNLDKPIDEVIRHGLTPAEVQGKVNRVFQEHGGPISQREWRRQGYGPGPATVKKILGCGWDDIWPKG